MLNLEQRAYEVVKQHGTCHISWVQTALDLGKKETRRILQRLERANLLGSYYTADSEGRDTFTVETEAVRDGGRRYIPNLDSQGRCANMSDVEN